MTKEQLWEQQERTWNDNNVFVTTETAWLAGYETRDRMTCEWAKKSNEWTGDFYETACDKTWQCECGDYEAHGVSHCFGCGGRVVVKEAK